MKWSGESASRVPISIPDYLIYDEIRRRRDSVVEREHLELPLYNPQMPARPTPSEEPREEKSERGPMIIDMNDLIDEDSEASESHDAPDDPGDGERVVTTDDDDSANPDDP